MADVYSESDVVLHRLAGARVLIDSALDHYKRSREQCTADQFRNRRSVASANTAEAMRLVSEAQHWMTAEMLGEGPFRKWGGE